MFALWRKPFHFPSNMIEVRRHLQVECNLYLYDKTQNVIHLSTELLLYIIT